MTPIMELEADYLCMQEMDLLFYLLTNIMILTNFYVLM